MAATPGLTHGVDEARLRWVPLRLALFGMGMFAAGTMLLWFGPEHLPNPATTDRRTLSA